MSVEDRNVFGGFDGSVFKSGRGWLVTTPVPSIPSAEIVEFNTELREGLAVFYDLVVIQKGNRNRYEATNLKIRTDKRKPKLSPKNKDRNRQKMV